MDGHDFLLWAKRKKKDNGMKIYKIIVKQVNQTRADYKQKECHTVHSNFARRKLLTIAIYLDFYEFLNRLTAYGTFI